MGEGDSPRRCEGRKGARRRKSGRKIHRRGAEEAEKAQRRKKKEESKGFDTEARRGAEVAEKEEEEGDGSCLLPPLSCFSVPLCLCGRFLSWGARKAWILRLRLRMTLGARWDRSRGCRAFAWRDGIGDGRFTAETRRARRRRRGEGLVSDVVGWKGRYQWNTETRRARRRHGDLKGR